MQCTVVTLQCSVSLDTLPNDHSVVLFHNTVTQWYNGDTVVESDLYKEQRYNGGGLSILSCQHNSNLCQ